MEREEQQPGWRSNLEGKLGSEKEGKKKQVLKLVFK